MGNARAVSGPSTALGCAAKYLRVSIMSSFSYLLRCRPISAPYVSKATTPAARKMAGQRTPCADISDEEGNLRV
eukprot:scaffold3886_cov399-Prasinococcus_capsulatus_cf.AAC.34